MDNELKESQLPAKRKMNKVLKITLIVLSAIIALLFLVTLLISPIAQSYVNKNGEKLVGRKVNVEKLKVNIYAGRIQIHNFALFEDDGTTEFLSFDTLDVQVKLPKLLHQEVNVSHLILSNLDVRVLQNGDQFNFTSLLDHFASSDTTEVDTTSGEPWALAFYNIRLSHWKVYYADLQKETEWNLKDINIEVPGVYFSGEQSTDAGITLALADGGTLTTNVQYNMESNDFAAELDLKQFAISNIRAYLTDAMNVGKLEGVLDACFTANGNLSEIMKMAISGNLALTKVDIRDLNDTPVLAFDKLGVDVNKIVLDDNLFDIALIELGGLNSRFDLFRNGSNFERFFDVKTTTPEPAAEPATPDTAASEPAKPMQLKLGKLNIHDGRFTYSDHTLPDPFSLPLTNISIQAENVSLSGENAARIFASLPHGGHADIRWNGTLDDIKRKQHLILNIKNLKLTDISPYSVAFLGQPFTDGTFSFTSENSIRNSNLEGKNRLDLYKPEVGKRRDDVDSALHLPLKAALYVLKDKDDKVILDIPISGNIDSPEFSYMKAVWKTLGNLFVKVATSPARALGNALGFNSDELEFIEVDPTLDGLSSEQYAKLDKLSDMSKYNESVVITMVQQLDKESPAEITEKAEKRNQAVLQYLEQIGAKRSQFVISTELVESPKKSGYTINSELKEEQ